jgi:ABC-type polysaccharide/polyol phosphate export permease
VDASLDANTADVNATIATAVEITPAQRAHRDIVDGLKLWPVWGALAWQDIRIRYIRTLLGPLWMTVSMAVSVFALGLVFSKIFNSNLGAYLPFLTSGMLIWGFISGVLLEAATTFPNAQLIILSVSAPYSMHAYRGVLRQMIIFGHNLLVFVGVILFVGVSVTPATLLFFPALILVCTIMAWVTLMLALIGTRFRDLQPIIATILQLFFFVTPLIWDRDQLAGRAHPIWVDINPFYHMVEIMRAPMLGKMPPLLTIAVVIAIAIGGWLATYAMFARFRRRIPYWL